MRVKSFNDLVKPCINDFLEKYGTDYVKDEKYIESFRKICDKLDAFLYASDCDDLKITVGECKVVVCIQCDMFVPDMDKDRFYDLLDRADTCVFTYGGEDLMFVSIEYPSLFKQRG